ncbi:acid protease, partial [Thozetella sp. PMI_491]
MRSAWFLGCVGVAQAAGPGFLRFPIAVKSPAAQSSGASKRQNAVDLTRAFLGAAYTIEVQLGTPEQTVSVQLDSGSSELWVNPNCSNYPGLENWCKSQGFFNSSTSSTFNNTGPDGSIVYGGGNVTFRYATDNVRVGSTKVIRQRFGVATDSYTEQFGILGIAPYMYPACSDPYCQAYLDKYAPRYPFFIESLVSQGFIASQAFSLDLRSIENPTGSLIYGGIDTGKYIGELEKLPIPSPSQTPDGSIRYWVSLDSVSTNNALLSNGSIVAILDSGSTLTRLPPYLHHAIAQSIPTSQLLSGNSGLYTVNCSMMDVDATVDFKFGGKVIQVAYKDIIYIGGYQFCLVGTVPAQDDFYILADSFLRAAYVVFDIDQMNIHMAQAADCGTNIMAIGSGADAVPSVVGECTSS